MNILMVGDVVGEGGCHYLSRVLPKLRREYEADAIIVNGENSAKGNGITPQSADMLFSAGADVITTGNHCFRRRCESLFDENPRILRPANYPEGAPGSGVFSLDLGRTRLAVINLMGTAFMEPLDNPFSVIDNILETLDTPCILVDFHAEATSEKRALGYYLSGRVSAVIGTHTHTQTADEECIDGKTAYISDVGMVGAARSVLGVCPEQAIQKQRFHVPVQFSEAPGPYVLGAVCLSIDPKTGNSNKIRRVFLKEMTN